MARRTTKAQAVMNSLSDSTDADSSSDDVSAPLSSVKREAAKARHVSLKEAATLLDRDRNTIMKWIDHGCPAVEKADRALGRPWVLDLAEVVRWLERRAADTAAEKSGDGSGKITEGEAKRRKMVAGMLTAETEAAELMRTVVRIGDVIDGVASDYNEIRGRLLSISDEVAASVETSLRAKVKEAVDTKVREALKALKVDRELDPGEG